MINAFKKLNVYTQALIILVGLVLLPISIGLILAVLAGKKITNRNWRYGTVASIIILTIFFGSAWLAAFSGVDTPKPATQQSTQTGVINNLVSTPEDPTPEKPATENKNTPSAAPAVQASDQPASSPVSQPPTSGVVKMSNSNICHAPGTTYYERTIHFTAYKTLQACLDAGGRLPKR